MEPVSTIGNAAEMLDALDKEAEPPMPWAPPPAPAGLAWAINTLVAMNADTGEMEIHYRHCLVAEATGEQVSDIKKHVMVLKAATDLRNFPVGVQRIGYSVWQPELVDAVVDDNIVHAQAQLATVQAVNESVRASLREHLALLDMHKGLSALCGAAFASVNEVVAAINAIGDKLKAG